MVQPTLQEMGLKEVHESFSSSSRRLIHEDRRLQIKELDEWQTHKPRTHDKPKLRQDELNTSPNQLKVGDKVLLDVADPHIVTTKLNKEISLTILSIFPFGTVEVSHPKFITFKVYHTDTAKHTNVLITVSKQGEDFLNMGYDKSPRPCDMVAWAYIHRNGRSERSQTQPCAPIRPRDTVVYKMSDASKFKIRESHGQKLRNTGVFPGCRLVRQLSVSEFGTALGLYTEEFKEENDLDTLNRHIHRSPSRCWDALVPGSATYNSSHSKASAIPPSLRYLHAILARTLKGRRKSTIIVNTHEAYFLWCMSHRHVIDLAHFIALTIQHQMERHRKGIISIGPYVTRLA
ncbi:hypothetical protein GOBAR_AA36279 [Gossypium barbadense]|uniref:Uncharacterized protein n=1 Tax=Gossypium barbadense TaxID=3634 RepID=A0A2P5W036_GOSBA|nr:hypothetical protein GOBAR_AA36279 [Gossypium barbadense]